MRLLRPGATHGARVDRGAVEPGSALVVAAFVATGLLVGLGAQRVTAGGDSAGEGAGQPSAEIRSPLAAFDCPDGSQVATLHGGDRIFVTGRHADRDGWLRVRDPLDPGRSWWVDATFVGVDGDLTALPGVDCRDVVVEAPGATGSTTSTTETTSTSSTTTTAPTTTSTGSPGSSVPTSGPATSGPPTSVATSAPVPTSSTSSTAPDTVGPTLSASVSPAEIWEQNGGGISCGVLPRQTVVTATVSDPSGIAWVKAEWTVGGDTDDVTLTGAGTRTAPIGPFAYHTIPSNTQQSVAVVVTARDNAGNESAFQSSFVLHSTDQCFG